MNKFLLSNTNGQKSLTATAFVIGFLVCNIKFLFSGITLYSYSFPAFSGSEYALALGALGAIYVLRRKLIDTNGDGKPDTEEV